MRMMNHQEKRDTQAQVFGSPGVRPRFTAFLKGVTPMLLFMALGGYFLRAALPYPGISPMVAGVALVGLCALFAVTLFMGEKRLAAYFKGAEGEELVARMLHRLPAEWTVFHGVMLPAGTGRRDIDHVLVGPAGVFVVETKNWSGRITVQDGVVLCNGRHPSRPPLEQAAQAACALQAALREQAGCAVEVLPVLCFAKSNVAGGSQGCQGVQICSPESLLDVISTYTKDGGLKSSEIQPVTDYLQSLERRAV
jgi:hypothetical protein